MEKMGRSASPSPLRHFLFWITAALAFIALYFLVRDPFRAWQAESEVRFGMVDSQFYDTFNTALSLVVLAALFLPMAARLRRPQQDRGYGLYVWQVVTLLLMIGEPILSGSFLRLNGAGETGAATETSCRVLLKLQSSRAVHYHDCSPITVSRLRVSPDTFASLENGDRVSLLVRRGRWGDYVAAQVKLPAVVGN